MKRRFFHFLLLPFLAWPVGAHALDYRSIAVDRAVLYDAPSVQARKLYLVTRYYPVEVIVDLEAFAKVRDVSGELAWVEKKNLADKRTVLVTVPLADVRQVPDTGSPLVFQAERSVALELIENTGKGWLKVRHPDGATGYVAIGQVWGA